MGDNSLPDELLQRILSLCLCLPLDVLFRDDDYRGFAIYKDDHSFWNPQFLRVSCRWLRVGTPLLYSGVRISNVHHARNIANLLKKHPHISAGILSLRFDGGSYGADARKIMRRSLNVKNLYLQLDVPKNAKGFKHALAAIQPETLYLRHEEWRPARSRTMVEDMIDLVLMCIEQKWTKLREVRLSDVFGGCVGLPAALQKAPSLEVLDLDGKDAWCSWTQDHFYFGPAGLKSLVQNPRLRTLRIRGRAEARIVQKHVAELQLEQQLGPMLQIVPNVHEMS